MSVWDPVITLAHGSGGRAMHDLHDLEECLPLSLLQRVVNSMKTAAAAAGVAIVTGDTKVVPRGAADQLFINTTGIGGIPAGLNLSSHNLQVGDVLMVNGYLGDHGTAILATREELALETPIVSDCQLPSLRTGRPPSRASGGTGSRYRCTGDPLWLGADPG